MADEDVAVPRTPAGLVGACVSPAGGAVVPAAGASATSWPRLAAAFAARATWVPVAPVALRVTSAPSRVTRNVPAFEVTSPRSVIPAGAVNVVATAVPKSPSSRVPGFVVTTEGAVTDVLDALT